MFLLPNGIMQALRENQKRKMEKENELWVSYMLGVGGKGEGLCFHFRMNNKRKREGDSKDVKLSVGKKTPAVDIQRVRG